MSAQILQINFKYKVSAAEYEQAVSPLAGPISEVPGLRWKIWLLNEQTSEAGGIFLFENRQALQAFLQGPIAAQVADHPALNEMSIKQFAVMEKQTNATRGPLTAMATSSRN